MIKNVLKYKESDNCGIGRSDSEDWARRIGIGRSDSEMRRMRPGE